MRKILPVQIVKFDVDTELPIRDKNGFCIECAPNEPGELIGKIVAGDPTREFAGYTDPSATKKKILNDVFVKGDSWFRTGDLLRWDEEGFIFFVDRIGDTFRWKGENVATSEVAQVISQIPGVLEANVYGVAIPHKDGRAGMASLVVTSEFSLEALFEQCKKDLPKFAAPVFVRLSKEMEITGTFKHRKVELVKEGFDPSTIPDPIYFRDDGVGKYVPLDKELYQKFLNNQMAKL
jgi:fatty-acyl-CoA synthase